MPLVILTGVPSSGKTTRANELENFFEGQNKDVHVISEYDQIVKAGFEKNSFYQDSNKEKHIRGVLKSEVCKIIGPTNLVILDGSNYIKGYRYELYCTTKANKSTQCTIHTEINREEAWKLNEHRENDAEKYDRKTFDELVMRYEDPHINNRWDSPLYVVYPDQEMNFKEIYHSLFEKKPPAPNMSTQNPPLSSTNYLYDMNRKVKEITTSLIGLVHKGCKEEVEVPGYEHLQINLKGVDMKELVTLSRQYLTYSKMHTPDLEQVPQLYIQYLISNLN